MGYRPPPLPRTLEIRPGTIPELPYRDHYIEIGLPRHVGITPPDPWQRYYQEALDELDQEFRGDADDTLPPVYPDDD